MATISLQNNSKSRQSYIVAGISFYIDAGYVATVDNTNGAILSYGPIPTQASTNTNALLTTAIQATSFGSKNIATNQITISSDKPYLICAARANRMVVTIINHSSNDVYVGNSSVTINSGIGLIGIPGNTMTLTTQADIWAVAVANTALISVLEAY